MLRYSNGYCSHSFHPTSSRFYGKYGNQGGDTGYYFSGDLPNFKIHGTSLISHTSYIDRIHNAMLFHLAKGQAECQGPWASCFYKRDSICQVLMIASYTSPRLLAAKVARLVWQRRRRGLLSFSFCCSTFLIDR